MEMTRRERLTAIFEGRAPDRSAVKLWGADPRHACRVPAYEPVRALALQRSDLFVGSGAPFHMYFGANEARYFEEGDRPTGSPDWVDKVSVFHTPLGDLRQAYRMSTRQKPGYQVEHLLKDPNDIRKLLSIPYEPFEFSATDYQAAVGQVGDAGLALFGLDHAMYALQRLIGSENFALWSLEADDLLLEGMRVFAGRLRQHAQAAIDAGIRGVFGWVGPELCIPPLMSPAAFDRYVTALDKPLVDMLHDAGGRIWVHCHGKMGPVLERFADMGVDVLNPIEPPPMGDITMAEAFRQVGDRMGLEGNLETHDIMTCVRDDIRGKIHATLAAGAGRRHIFCPSSGYQESIDPSAREIDNWNFFIEEGIRCAEALAGRPPSA